MSRRQGLSCPLYGRAGYVMDFVAEELVWYHFVAALEKEIALCLGCHYLEFPVDLAAIKTKPLSMFQYRTVFLMF